MPIVYPQINMDNGVVQSPIFRRTPIRTRDRIIGACIRANEAIFPTENLITAPNLNIQQRRASARLNCDVSAVVLDRQLPVILNDDMVTVGFVDHIPLETQSSSVWELITSGSFNYYDVSAQNGLVLMGDGDLEIQLYDLDWPFLIHRLTIYKPKYDGAFSMDFRGTKTDKICVINRSPNDVQLYYTTAYVISL